MNGIEFLSKVYNVPVIDYGTDRGNGILVATGSGLMMTIMDMRKEIRYCVETKELLKNDMSKYWIMELQTTVDLLLFVAWLSITPESKIQELFSLILDGRDKFKSKSKFYYLCNCHDLNCGKRLLNLKELENENFTFES